MRATIEIVADSRQVKAASQDLKNLQQQGQRTEQATGRLQGGFANVGRKAGQAGVQVQQLVGQIQGGGNAMLAASQQAADLGIVLGAPLAGAVAGLAASFAMVLLPSVFDTRTELEKLEEALELVGDTVAIEDGIARLTDEVRELAKASEAAAKAQLAQEIIDAKNAITSAQSVVKDGAFGDLGLEQTLRTFENFNDRLAQGGLTAQQALAEYNQQVINLNSDIINLPRRINALSEALGINEEQAKRFLSALGPAINIGDATSLQNLQNVLGQLNEETGFSSKALIEFTSGLSEAFAGARNASEIIQIAEGFLKDFGGALESTSESAIELAAAQVTLEEALRQQVAIAKESGVEQAKLAAAFKLGLDSIDDLPPAIAALVEELFKLESANKTSLTPSERLINSLEQQVIELRDGADAAEDFAIAQRLGADATDAERKKVQALVAELRELREEKEKEKERDKDAETGRTIGLSDELLIRQQLKDDLIELKRLENEGLLSEEASYQERRANLIAEAEERIAKLQESTQLIDWESFGNQATGALAAVATGAMSGREAVRGLAMSLAQEAIGALVKMAVQSTILKQKETAEGVTQAGTLASAYAPAATAASIATSGGAATSGATALLAAVPAMIASFAIAGGRANGGQVIGGNSYLVGERGPEIVTMGGNGNVTPYNNLMRAANQRSEQKVNVIVENYGSERATVREETMSDERIIRVVVGDINARREIPKALSQVGNYQNRAR